VSLAEKFPPRRERPGQPLAKARELEPVARPKKEPRSSLPRQSARGRERKQRQFGEQAQRCRESRCACCNAPPPCDPHHWPTTANGGLDRDTCPLCPACHAVFHDSAGSPEAFLALMGCDLLAEIERMRRAAPKTWKRSDHECIPKLVERERTLDSYYVCRFCGRRFSEEEVEALEPEERKP
jgi:hypothetical protein